LILSKPEKFDVETTEPSDITASTLRHDTRTVNLALVQCNAIPKNKLSLHYLNQLIGIKLLTSGFLEILVRIPISRWKMAPMPPTADDH